MITVGDSLREFANEHGISFETYLETWLGARVAPSVPERYKQLVREVALRLPAGWDEHAEWSVAVSPERNPPGYAHIFREEEAGGETVTPYLMTVYPSLMDSLSDSACRWVLAHEFAHIASQLPTGSIVINGETYTSRNGNYYMEVPGKTTHEDAADKIALDWGFDREWFAFEEETTH